MDVAALRKHAPEIAGRIEYVLDPDERAISRIDCGVLFIMAWWSSYAVHALGALSSAVGREDPQGRARIIVFDTDRMASLVDLPDFAERLHGNGETFWVRHGRIVAANGPGFDTASYCSHTRALLGRTDDS